VIDRIAADDVIIDDIANEQMMEKIIYVSLSMSASMKLNSPFALQII
jgi:hypothetical protein